MIHLEGFNSIGEPGEMEELLGRVIPYWRSRGFQVEAYARVVSLGKKEFYLATHMDRLGDIDDWESMAQGEEEGKSLMAELIGMAVDFEAIVITEMYPAEE